MEQSNEQEASPTSEQRLSFGHLLLAWFLVGSSFWTLGFALFETIPAAIPLSRMGAGLLFGTIVIVLLWSVGWHPSLSACAGYFIAESAFSLLLLLGIAPVFSRELTPWMVVSLHSTSIALAATLVFTNYGKQIRNRARQRTRSLLKLPSEDHSPSQE